MVDLGHRGAHRGASGGAEPVRDLDDPARPDRGSPRPLPQALGRSAPAPRGTPRPPSWPPPRPPRASAPVRPMTPLRVVTSAKPCTSRARGPGGPARGSVHHPHGDVGRRDRERGRRGRGGAGRRLLGPPSWRSSRRADQIWSADAFHRTRLGSAGTASWGTVTNWILSSPIPFTLDARSRIVPSPSSGSVVRDLVAASRKE